MRLFRITPDCVMILLPNGRLRELQDHIEIAAGAYVCVVCAAGEADWHSFIVCLV